MNDRYYTQYVRHCLRFYARYDNPDLSREIDRLNWSACDRAIKAFDNDDKNMLLAIYRGADTVADNIYNLSKTTEIAQNYIWKLTAILEYRIAQERGLV